MPRPEVERHEVSEVDNHLGYVAPLGVDLVCVGNRRIGRLGELDDRMREAHRGAAQRDQDAHPG
jgi:hypothetical protein